MSEQLLKVIGTTNGRFSIYELNNRSTHADSSIDMVDLQAVFKECDAAMKGMHSHPFYLVVWIEHGDFDIYIETEKYHIKDNTILLLRPGELHAVDHLISIKGSSFIINPEVFVHTTSDVAGILGNILFSQNHTFSMNTEERRRQLQPYLQLLRAECEKAPENIFDLERRIHLMLLLLLKLLEFSEVCTSKSTHKGEHEHSLQLYLRFVDLLKAHYAKRLSVQDYADKLHTSTRVLAACTHRYENCPPVQTINNFLLAQARRYLLYTPLTIKEIGLKLGFNRPPILSTSFHSGRVYRHRNTGLGSINAQLTQQAIRYLHTTSDSVKEIAHKLGFCDASNYVILVSGKTSKSYLTFYLPRTTD